ncbi:MAG: hypothetical protein E6Q97_03460 [Desulfurellales bacterium]|nr:MAG: hypothetical protein E6Q97_03460 [Desulfurellales bacterium]
MNPVFLSDSVWLHFGTSSATTGAATNADSTPTVVVAEDGVDMGYAPSVTNVATGLYKVEIAATAGNGFEAGKRYSVYAVATVGGITGRDGLDEFEVLAVDLNTGVASVTGAVNSVTNDVGITQAAADKAWSTTTRQLTAAQTFNLTGDITGNLSGSVGSVTGLTAANLDVAVSTRLASASYTAPDNATIAAIQVDTDDIQTRLPAALVSGRMASIAEVVGDKSGYSLAAGSIVAGTFATDAIDANAVAASAVTKIQLGLATDADMATVLVDVDELRKLAGLELGTPLVVTGTTRVAGAISQTIVEAPAGTVTVTRV